MKNKYVSLLCCLVLGFSLLTGCGSEEVSKSDDSVAVAETAEADADSETAVIDTTSETTEAETASEAEEADSSSGSENEEEAEEVDPDDITTIEYYNLDLAEGTDISAVAEAVNEISEKEIGVHVNFNLMDFGSYLQQIGLNLAGNERMDLISYTPAAPVTFGNMTSLGQLLDIKDLLEEYGTDITADLGEFIKGDQIGDGIYGVTSHSQFATDMYILMRGDILEELGLTEKAENLSSWSEFEEILEAVHEANENGTLPEELQTNSCISNCDNAGRIFPAGTIMCGADKFEDNYGIDVLGDNYSVVATDTATDTVSEYYASDDYYEMLKRVKSWNEKGYVYKDAAFTDQGGDNLLKNGVTFSYIVLGNYGIEEDREKITGYDIVATKVLSIPMGSNVCQTWGAAVPTTAEEPEAAVKFLNLMYSNSEVMNLLTWGVEGKDYTLNDEGEAVKTDTSTYNGFGFLWGNSTIAYPTEGTGADFRQKAREMDEKAPISKYMGFVVDASEFANELTAINNLTKEYKASLESGVTSDLEGDYKTFLEKLDAAGIQKVIDGYQQQLSQWLEASK